MYKEHGKLVERKSRGWKQQQTSKALRGEAPGEAMGDQQSGEDEEGEEIVESDGEGEDEDDGDFEDDGEDADADAVSDD
jgi:hypothetical protein